jgi:hypothetical protein
MCERWRDSFENFLSDMGERPEGMTLDRLDNTRGYEPGNCRWADSTTQAVNKRHIQLHLFEGELLPLKHVAKKANVAYSSLKDRMTRKQESLTEAVAHLRSLKAA